MLFFFFFKSITSEQNYKKNEFFFSIQVIHAKLGHKKSTKESFGYRSLAFSVGVLPNSLLQSVFASSAVLAFLILSSRGRIGKEEKKRQNDDFLPGHEFVGRWSFLYLSLPPFFFTKSILYLHKYLMKTFSNIREDVFICLHSNLS